MKEIKEEEQISKNTIEKPREVIKEFDLSLIKPDSIISNNLLILPSKKNDKKIFQKEQKKIYNKPEIQIKKQFDLLSISSISINIDGKDFRISKDDSKDVTKDFTKDHTREISKDTSRKPKNTIFDDDVV